MNTPVRQRSLLSRSLRGSLALACVATLLVGSTANAASTTILQFAQTNPADSVTATNVGGTTTMLSTAGNLDGGGLSIPVSATNYLGVPQPLGLPMFETYVGVTSVGPATTVAGSVTQDFMGTVEFTSAPGGAGAIFLIATFGPTGVFSGGSTGGSGSLNASVPSDTVTFTIPGFSFANPALSLSFSGIAPPVSITGTSIGSFTGQNSGTFSATIIPEPSTLCLASIAVVVGTLVYGRKKMKNQG